MPREILRAKLYELIKNIEDESTLIEISNMLNNMTQNESKVNYEADNLEDFIDDNVKILSGDEK